MKGILNNKVILVVLLTCFLFIIFLVSQKPPRNTIAINTSEPLTVTNYYNEWLNVKEKLGIHDGYSLSEYSLDFQSDGIINSIYMSLKKIEHDTLIQYNFVYVQKNNKFFITKLKSKNFTSSFMIENDEDQIIKTISEINLMELVQNKSCDRYSISLDYDSRLANIDDTYIIDLNQNKTIKNKSYNPEGIMLSVNFLNKIDNSYRQAQKDETYFIQK